MATTRSVGRPRVRGEDEPRQYVGGPLPLSVKRQLEAAAAASGRSLAQEFATRLAQTFEGEKLLTASANLAFGCEANAALVHLLGEITRMLAPRGQWLDEPAGRDATFRGHVHLWQRLAAPGDTHVVLDQTSPEGKVDDLLFAIGDDGSDHPGPLLAQQRWAAEVRERLGPIGPLLVEMRQVVKKALQAMPPRDLPAPDPETSHLWDKALARALPGDDLAELRREIEAYRRGESEHSMAFIKFAIQGLPVDPATRQQLTAALVQAAAERAEGTTAPSTEPDE